jgi:ABC-type methionine transport system ATPase subunit
MAEQPHLHDRPNGNCFELAEVTQTRGNRTVLDRLTVNLPDGELIALIGPSGAGKTSLLRLLNRLDDPVSGEVRFRGNSLREYPVRSIRRRVGFVFQTATMFPGTVADNLLTAHSLGRNRKESMAAGRTLEVLRLVELDTDYAPRIAGDLSGGEKQRVALARALITAPEVLLLDEPTSALDPEVADRLIHTLSRLRNETQLTIVMVTHRLSEARAASTYTVMLEAGRLIEQGPTAQMIANPAHERTRAYIASGG